MSADEVVSGMFRSFKYRLEPTAAQARQFAHFAGVCRLIYNAALWQRENQARQFRENTGRTITYLTQAKELTDLRDELPWVGEVSVVCQQQALRDLDTAFRRFFARTSSYPKPRRKGQSDSFYFPAPGIKTAEVSGRWSAVRLPKIGWVKFRDTRPMDGTLKNVTIIQNAGHWYVSFTREIDQETTANDLPAVGIDMGVARTLTLSTGEYFSVPLSLAAIEKRQRRARRVLSRRKRGSVRYAKQRRRVAAMSARCARIRKDWQHRVTTDICRRFGTVIIEDLNVIGMTAKGRGKRGLNRSILNQGWGQIAFQLGYKLAERGGDLIAVPAVYTSQTCANCGAIDPRSRKSQSVFECVHCGHQANADENAALNILSRGSAPGLRVEAHDYRAVETRTLIGGSST